MASTRDVWYVVVIGEGKPSSASKVKISRESDLDDFREAVHVLNPNIFAGIDLIQLQVYANKTAYVREEELDGRERIGEQLGSVEELYVVVPSHDSVAVSDLIPSSKKQRLSVSTDQFKAFKNATFVEQCIISTDGMTLPYPNEKLQKIFVRKCYADIFALFVKRIQDGVEVFGISGTPGIGKSLFFVYLLYRLVHGESSFKPKRIIYQTALDFSIFDLEVCSVCGVERADIRNLVQDPGTLYIIDGKDSVPVPSLCVVLFIASPRSVQYQEFVKQKKAQEWFLPVWTLNELYECRQECYPHFNITTLDDRYRIFGGVARPAFRTDAKMLDMDAALIDVDAVKCVRNIAAPTRIYQNAHMLLHIIVSDDGNYQFECVDIASKYVGQQLWQLHSAQMLVNLQEMFGGSPSVMSGHLFEMYGHKVFAQGGKTLNCRNLEDGFVSQLTLSVSDGKRVPFTRNSIPKKPIDHYYEPLGDDSFPAIDSLSPQGMFQFTVGAQHPIRGVQILKDVCKAFDKPYKLFFVVPPHRFATFEKQEYKKTKGNDSVNPIEDLEQYVLELEVSLPF
ncbi:hypothetical protein Ae201684P_009436 [Aphanomyces euteiches]|uniref:Crinkler effector protein N-terminal domain-containing protein n=1 Tax=Aphanomyces euteiches TaxID=100861 RepID=A0A6G0WL06_9STRA|nr:hypothetical protein Ae201684_014086 [Aphanomyces euteiches]KAH9096199.1 hypothetical protein Ae201684P_009436 [Aphanomyces euteiches]